MRAGPSADMAQYKADFRKHLADLGQIGLLLAFPQILLQRPGNPVLVQENDLIEAAQLADAVFNRQRRPGCKKFLLLFYKAHGKDGLPPVVFSGAGLFIS